LLTSECKNINEQFRFPYDTTDKLTQIVHRRKNEILRKIENIQIIQSRLPKQLHDYNEYDNLIQDIKNLEK